MAWPLGVALTFITKYRQKSSGLRVQIATKMRAYAVRANMYIARPMMPFSCSKEISWRNVNNTINVDTIPIVAMHLATV